MDARSSYSFLPFAERHFYEPIDHPAIGKHFIPGAPFRFSSRREQPWIRCPSPMLGQHNHEVLKEILRLSSAEIADLEAKQIIGNKPANL
jgi:crotonobetainyl-CoA:carnitine CoA-transferase CaiB-like acyl-CoA transferase